MDNIKIDYPVSELDENTTLITAPDMDWAERRANEILRSALENYSYEPLSSVIPTDTTTSQKLTLAWIDEVASGLNSSKDNILTVNALILKYILEDGYLGRAYESVTSNVNTAYRLTYNENELAKENADELSQVKNEIDYFNNAVGLKQLIRDCIARVYAEGNCPLMYRYEKGKAPSIDLPPLSLVYPSDYTVAGGRQSVLEFDVSQLKARLQKTYKKTKKNKEVYFKNIADEIHNNYPKEVEDAYKSGDNYVRLDPARNAIVKINDLGRKFGVSPLFRTLRPMIILSQIEEADVSDSKARSRKYIVQISRKEILGQNGERKALDQTAHAHQQAAAALKTTFGVYTPPAWIESLSYLQAKSQNEDSIQQMKQYTQKLLTALGIGFTDIGSTVGAAKISVSQLLKTVNAIGENLETVLNLFYRTWVADNGHDPKFAPTIRIIDAEQMEMDVKKDLAAFVYGTLNASLTTALDILDMDIDDEMAKRAKENADGIEEIFYPRKTAYTNGDNNDSNGTGRPASNQDEDKRDFDQEYTKDVR